MWKERWKPIWKHGAHTLGGIPFLWLDRLWCCNPLHFWVQLFLKCCLQNNNRNSIFIKADFISDFFFTFLLMHSLAYLAPHSQVRFNSRNLRNTKSVLSIPLLKVTWIRYLFWIQQFFSSVILNLTLFLTEQLSYLGLSGRPFNPILRKHNECEPQNIRAFYVELCRRRLNSV